jgi:hypothetical protein
MKLLYVASVLLATAAITRAQVIAAIVEIEILIGIFAEETGETAVISLSNEFRISAAFGAEEVTFSSETTESIGSIAEVGRPVEFDPIDVSLTDFDPVDFDVEDEICQANLRWTQEITVFGEAVSVDVVTGIDGSVTVTEDAVAFAEDGGFRYNTITVNNPALTPGFLPVDSSVTFSVP